MFLIRAGAIENLDRLIRQYGFNPNEVMAEFGLDSAMLREPEALISYTKVADLLDHCAEVCGDPLFGLRLTQLQSPLAIGELLASSSQQGTLKEALGFTNKYMRLHAHGVRLITKTEGERLQIHFDFEFTNSTGLKQLTLLSTGQLFQSIYALIGTEVSGLKIHIIQSYKHENLNSLTNISSHLKQSSHFDGVSIPLIWMNKANDLNNEALKVHFKQRISTLENMYPEDLASQIRYLCSTWLSSGDCTLERVSSALDLHPRVLQKRLLKQNLSFRSLLQKVRQIKAEQLLRNGRMSVTDIALYIGYAETAVFSRNFKKWTGKTPLQWRGEKRALL